MTAWAVAAVVLCGAVLAWLVVVNVGRVRRLDRLHRRLDATRVGLAAALEVRCDMADRVAEQLADLVGPSAGDMRADLTSSGSRSVERAGALRSAVAAARSAGPDREPAENELGRALGSVDRSVLPYAVATSMADAELRLLLARRVHNDAVRDTLALRSRRLVRLFRLAGTAPMPEYFEIADPPGVTGPALTAMQDAPLAPSG